MTDREDECAHELHRLAKELGLADEGPQENVDAAITLVKRQRDMLSEISNLPKTMREACMVGFKSLAPARLTEETKLLWAQGWRAASLDWAAKLDELLGQSEVDQAVDDMRIHGTGYLRDDKHVPFENVMKTLQITPRLRFVERPLISGSTTMKVLQQAWVIRETGELQWHDVPVEDES